MTCTAKGLVEKGYPNPLHAWIVQLKLECQPPQPGKCHRLQENFQLFLHCDKLFLLLVMVCFGFFLLLVRHLYFCLLNTSLLLFIFICHSTFLDWRWSFAYHAHRHDTVKQQIVTKHSISNACSLRLASDDKSSY